MNKSILFSLLLFVPLSGCNPTVPPQPEDLSRDPNSFSIGMRAGTITKLSRKGMKYLSFEGQLAATGVSTVQRGDPAVTVVVSNPWEFSIADADRVAADEARAAMCTGERVVCVYEQLKSTNDQVTDTSYRLKAVLRYDREGRKLLFWNGEPYRELSSGLPDRSIAK